MNSEEPLANTKETSSIKELLVAFFRPLTNFFSRVASYLNTSISVCLAKRLDQNENSSNSGIQSDINYAYSTVEFLLIIVFISKLAEFNADLNEAEEVAQDFAVLLFYVVGLFLFILSGRWFSSFSKKLSKRVKDKILIYEFNFLFLPSYMLIYIPYLIYGDDDLIGVTMVLLCCFWFIHSFYYFYRYGKELKLSPLKNGLNSFILALAILFWLSFSMVFVIGASIMDE